MTRILISINNFWVGGRETYLASWLENVTSVEAVLMASSIQESVPGLDRFVSCIEVAADDVSRRLQRWLQMGGENIHSRRPTVIWAHHFDLLPAWLLSRLHGVPLLTTFHGPLLSGTRPNRSEQALGMTLAIHRGDVVSGVSPEVCEDLETLGRPEATVLPNVVRFNPESTRPCLPPRRFLLITRRDKLEHIRQGVLLFCAYASRVRGAHLVVADGDSALGLESRTRAVPERYRRAMRQLGRKWMVRQGLPVIRHLSKMEFIGWTDDPIKLIREADLVMGMGRVALEGAAENRPVVLVGYEELHGLLTTGRFDEFRYTNFSGRRCNAVDRDQLAESLATTTEPPDLADGSDLIDVTMQARRFREALDRIAELKVVEPSDGMVNNLLKGIRRGDSDAEISQTATEMLTHEELETFERLKKG